MTAQLKKGWANALVSVGVAALVTWSCDRREEHRGHGRPQPSEQPASQATMPSEHAGHAAHAGHEAHAPPSDVPAPDGYAPVTVDANKRGALQLETARIEARDLARTLRTVGVVTLDETRSAHVHPKVRGWVEEIHVDFVGRRVQAGEPLASIHSQEVLAAQLELLSLLERGPSPLLDAARRRLSLWDVPASELARLESTREPRRTFPLLAPRAGTVVAKQAVQGMYVDPSIELYTLSDLSRVWVLADVYEGDVEAVGIGAPARLTVEGRADPVEAKVTFMAPVLDEATRTRKVRLEAKGSDRLLPGAFVDVELQLDLGRGLVAPESSVIRTGARTIVFVAHGDLFMPREVRLGPRVGDVYRVEHGLREGEEVAVGAQFLLDSESRLRATGGGGGHAH